MDACTRQTLPPGPASPRRRSAADAGEALASGRPPPPSEDDALFSGDVLQRFSVQHYVKQDGCNDFGAPRARLPWEASDGAVCLLRELAPLRPDAVAALLPAAAEAARADGFPGALRLRGTVWRCLPAIARGIGKGRFKEEGLPLFAAPLLADARCGHGLTEAAAAACLGGLRDLIGQRILEGRLAPEQAEALRGLALPPPAPRAPLAAAAGGGGPPRGPLASGLFVRVPPPPAQ